MHGPSPTIAGNYLTIGEFEALDDMGLIDSCAPGLPRCEEDGDFAYVGEFLFQDSDHEMVFSGGNMLGSENPDHPRNQALGIGNYRPAAWFNTFDNAADRAAGTSPGK